MNGGPLSYTNNNSADPSSAVNENGLKAQSPQSPEANGVTDSSVSLNGNGNNGVGHPLHIPAKRVVAGGHWTSPSSVASSTTASSYSLIDTHNSSVALPTSVDPLMAVSAASPYPTSHYSSLAASEAVRRATPTGMTDTKPGLSFWQNDYHKYAAASAASVGGASVSTTQSNTTSPSAAASIAATEPSCQMTTAAGFAAQQAAAWNYPHPSHYGVAALTSPEQAAAEAARARQMAADSAGFHAAADYTRLQYPPDGIYTHPPGM